MRNVFIGLISAYDSTRNLEVKKTSKNRDYYEESKYIYTNDACEQKNKKPDYFYVDPGYLNFISIFIIKLT
jgi:hypothetical protein